MTTRRHEVAAFAAHGPRAPSYRVRVELLRPRLASLSVDVRPYLLYSEAEAEAFATGSTPARARVLVAARRRMRHRLVRNPDGAGTTLVQRRVDVLPSLGLERLATEGRRVVYDVDDAIWIDGPASHGSLPALIKGSERKVRWLASRADHVVAGNEILAEHLGRHASRLTVIPSLVDPERIAVREHEAADGVHVGWIGSRTTANFLTRLAGPLERFARAIAPRPVRFTVIGGPAPDVRGVEVVPVAWTEASERAGLAEFDIGVMPLPDEPWTRGKCAYKALQYMAAGIPVVADDVGISGDVIGRGSAGVAARTPDEWVDGLVALAGDPGQRARMGAAGRARVEADFSVQRWGPTLASILRGDD